MRFIIFISLIYAFVPQPVAGQCEGRFHDVIADTFILHQDIAFGENIDVDGELYTLLMDVYEPPETEDGENGEDLRPLIILLHGGSFTGGNKTDGEVRWICEDLAKRGLVAASINYRVESNPLSLISEESMVKAVVRSVEDAKAGIRFFYRHADEGNTLRINTDHILLGGSSAGSICALHTVFMDEFTTLKPKWKDWIRDLGVDTVELNGSSGNAGYPDDVIGLVNISGAIASLDFLDNNTDIPIINIHNTVDLSVPYQFGHPYFIPTLPIVAGSRAIQTRMESNQANSRLLSFDALNHVPHTEFITGEQLFPEYDEVLGAVLDFISDVIPCNQLATAVEDTRARRLNAWPNPATDFIRITGLPEGAAIRFDVYDAAGRMAAGQVEFLDGKLQVPETLRGNNWYYFIGRDNDGAVCTFEVFLLR
jgi:hypothetical protein